MSKHVAGIAAVFCAATGFASEVAPFLSFGVQPAEVAPGTSVRLSWASLNTDTCIASGDWSGAQPPSGKTATPALAAPATFTLTCTGPGGSIERRVFVNVMGVAPERAADAPARATEAAQAAAIELPASAAPAATQTSAAAMQLAAPIATGTPDSAFVLDATPLAVTYGADTTITWRAPDASKCIASGAWSGAKAATGKEVIRGLHGEARFTLTCMGARGATTKEVGVTVSAAAPVTVNLSAAAKVLAPNQETTLAWTSTGAESCNASGAWLGPRSTMGSEPTSPLAASSTFAITCSGPGGTASDSVAITVNAETAAALSYLPDAEVSLPGR